MDSKKVRMGDMVKDKVSGFSGVIVSEHNFLNGCTRMTVQPLIDKDGKLPDTHTFDEPQLEVVKKDVAESEPKEGRTGGDNKFMDEGRPGE